MTGANLGDLEQLALLAVLRLGDGAYAVSVRDEILQRTDRTVTRGAVYVTLDRLEDKGYLRSAMSEPTAARGGKGRRVFSMEDAGRMALQQALANVRAMTEGLDPSLDVDPGTA